jgi:hypothetical protein
MLCVCFPLLYVPKDWTPIYNIALWDTQGCAFLQPPDVEEHKIHFLIAPTRYSET